MKTNLYTIVPLLLAGLLIFTACKDDDTTFAPSSEETQVMLLAGESGKTWDATSITFESGPPPSNMLEGEGFSITFNPDGTYTSVNGNPAFFSSGTWMIKGAGTPELELYTIIKDGNTANEVSYTPDLIGNNLELTFDVPADGGSFGRFSGLGGTFVFVLEARD